MQSLAARLERIREQIEAIPEVPASDAYDPLAVSALASVGLHASVAAAMDAIRKGEPHNYDVERYNWSEAAGFDSWDAMVDQLDEEGLLYGPLDDSQKARLEQIRDETKARWGDWVNHPNRREEFVPAEPLPFRRPLAEYASIVLSPQEIAGRIGHCGHPAG